MQAVNILGKTQLEIMYNILFMLVSYHLSFIKNTSVMSYLYTFNQEINIMIPIYIYITLYSERDIFF